MRHAARSLAILALSTVIGCSSHTVPTSSPNAEPMRLTVYSSVDTMPLLTLLSESYMQSHPEVLFESQLGNEDSLQSALQARRTPFFISHHFAPHANLWAAPLAQDALVLVTHPENPIDNLSSDALLRLYRGYITNWSEVGGTNQEIILFSREEGSSIRAEFERLVMGQQRIFPNAQVLASSESLLEQVSQQAGALAYLPLSQVTADIKVLAIDGVLPSAETVLERRYPLRMTIYLIGLEEASGIYRDFAAWVQGLEGQNLLHQAYIPLLN